MTLEGFRWLIGSIGILFLISISALFETEDKKIDRKWEFQMHNGHAALLILKKAEDLYKERVFWGEIWTLEYDHYNNLTSSLHEQYVFGEKLLSLAKILHIMFYSIPFINSSKRE